MAWPRPIYQKSAVDRAGKYLRKGNSSLLIGLGLRIAGNWRAAHGYPMKTFHSILRKKLGQVDSDGLIAQRLKRMESIIAKLKREKSMELSSMHDIGGLRAVTKKLSHAKELERLFISNKRFKHELIKRRDYIENPKKSGYRSIHLIYKYNGNINKSYNDLYLELQIRTRLQHAWATAVETMGTYLNHSLKSSSGPKEWLSFFALCSSAFAYLEETPRIPGFENLDYQSTLKQVVIEENKLKVIDKLMAFRIATNKITTAGKKGAYHLIILDLSTRMLNIKTYTQKQLEKADEDYLRVERQIVKGADKQAVLVSGVPISQLRKAYPNYYLDTEYFIRYYQAIKSIVTKQNTPLSR